jgi:SAM-dependent methyltransferase
LGCGHGRVSLPLARAGRLLVGIDRDWEVLSFLGRLIESQSPDLQNRIQIIQADFLEYHSPPIYDSVILPCNTFSTLERTHRIRLLNGVIRMLKPGGSLILSMPNPERRGLLNQPLFDGNDEHNAEIESTITDPDSGLPVQVSSQMMPTQGGMILEWIYDLLLPDGNVERFIKSTEHYFVPLDVYQNELKTAGFAVEESLGDFSGGDYDQDSPFLIVIAKSP